MLSILFVSSMLTACGDSGQDGVTQIHVVQYKPEAVAYFERLQEEFNAAHDDIQLTIKSPNDAMTILKTKFVWEDYLDIVGIGGDMNIDSFVMPANDDASKNILNSGIDLQFCLTKEYKNLTKTGSAITVTLSVMWSSMKLDSKMRKGRKLW